MSARNPSLHWHDTQGWQGTIRSNYVVTPEYVEHLQHPADTLMKRLVNFVSCNFSEKGDTISYPWSRQPQGQQLMFLVWLVGARVGKNDSILQKSGLCILIAVFDQWVAGTEVGNCFNSHGLKCLPAMREFKDRMYFSLSQEPHI